MPYTAMAVSALRMGLSYSELAGMPFPRLVMMLREWADMNSPEQGGARQATQQDIVDFLH